MRRADLLRPYGAQVHRLRHDLRIVGDASHRLKEQKRVRHLGDLRNDPRALPQGERAHGVLLHLDVTTLAAGHVLGICHVADADARPADMGQDQSRQPVDEAEDGEVSLWQGVPAQVRWLAQAQVRLLLMNHEALLYRPEQLARFESSAERSAGAGTDLHDYELKLANAAVRDRSLAPLLQRVLDRLVPSRLVESQFWENLFAHCDVIKVHVVTDYLRAQDLNAQARRERIAGWVDAYDDLPPDLQADSKRAAEAIAAEARAPEPSAAEAWMGFEPRDLPRWRMSRDEGAWLEYAEGGPWEIAKILRRMLEVRRVREQERREGESAREAGTSDECPTTPARGTADRDGALEQAELLAATPSSPLDSPPPIPPPPATPIPPPPPAVSS